MGKGERGDTAGSGLGPGVRVLLVDDDASVRRSLRMILEYEGLVVEEASSGAQGLAKVAERMPEAMLLDVKMPDMDGLEVLRNLQERGYDFPVLVISGHGDVSTAVEATRLGAFDFLEKPLQSERVMVSLRNAVRGHRLASRYDELRGATGRLIGETPAMKALRKTIERAGPTPATVLITGESGTGKELVARAIHEASPRRDRPLVQVNCAAIPDELIESELFGHEKGSFTGAVRKQVGKFVAADGGTIFLDEIGDMSARTQAKVLRVLQSGEVEPVGAATSSTVDVRVVAATHRDLVEEIEAGRFREDLFYRLNVLPIETPPLRERLDDLPLLIEHFVERLAAESGYPAKRFTDEAYEVLRSMPWKGNVRELRNLVERLLILGNDEEIGRGELLSGASVGGGELSGALLALPTLKEFREASERLFLVTKLEENGWNVTQTAQAIQTPRSNLYKKLESYDIRREE
ncbi:MAG: sigma-54-dependent Fis family transcriptional regulator [Acidobacteria bacterium]|nr:MAG: sigma-54-dependent Fis family transcriptional regulator [Acidobacteriota bacterium]REK00197.1 MAG: sigma-54-dependent Fis family transcriptional regulator [Acidobacteriota bacterium]